MYRAVELLTFIGGYFMSQVVDEYEIECYNKFSWGYIYSHGSKRRDIWADSLEKLKEKVLAKGLPWDSEKVPEEKPVKIVHSLNTRLGSLEGSTVQFRLPWCKSNYKRY